MALNPTRSDSDTTDARIAEVYRQAAGEDSPRHLDIALMAAAREGLERHRPTKQPWWISWQMPFAVAALAVVSVSLVTLMMDEGGDRVGGLESPRAPAPVSVPREAPVVEAPPAPLAAVPVEEPQVRLERAPSRGGAGKPSAATTSEAGAATTAREQVEERVSRDTALAREKAAPAVPATASSDVAQYSSAPASAPPAASGAHGRPESDARVAEDRPAARPSPSARAAPLLKAEPQLRRQELGAAASPQPRSREVERHVRELESESARAWLERIQLLRRDGRGTEATELLVEFRRRFPEEPVPVELR